MQMPQPARGQGIECQLAGDSRVHTTPTVRLQSADEITTILGELPPDQFEQRARLRTCRAIASSKVHSTESAFARTLLWMACDLATANIFASHPVEDLTEMATLCRRLVMCADQAERLGAP